LKTGELNLANVQKSAKEYKRVRKNMRRKGIVRKHAGKFAGANVRTSKAGAEGGTHPSKWIVFKIKELREEHFVSV